MSIRSISKMGNLQLAEPSIPITQFGTKELYKLIEDMRETMKVEDGIGIAAPQIGSNQRVIMFGYEEGETNPSGQSIPFTVLINPIIEVLDDTLVDGWEACISVPELCGLVSRYKKIKFSGFDPEGNPISAIAEDYYARVLQHETDHLDGILYPQRVKDLRYFGFQDEIIERIRKRNEVITD